IERLDEAQRRDFVLALSEEFDPEVIAWLAEQVRDEVIELLGPDRVARAVSELETDDAVYLLEDLEEAEQREVLEAVPAGERALLEQGLDFPEDSAGRLMRRELVAAPPHWTVGQTIDFMRAAANLPDNFYEILVVDPRHRPIGTIAPAR